MSTPVSDSIKLRLISLKARVLKMNTCHSSADGKFCASGGSVGRSGSKEEVPAKTHANLVSIGAISTSSVGGNTTYGIHTASGREKLVTMQRTSDGGWWVKRLAPGENQTRATDRNVHEVAASKLREIKPRKGDSTGQRYYDKEIKPLVQKL